MLSPLWLVVVRIYYYPILTAVPLMLSLHQRTVSCYRIYPWIPALLLLYLHI